MELSKEQQTAVERMGQDACVVAGPGSGKTRVLVERFAWLVEMQRTDPGRILAITFTEKAARMMKRRLVERFREKPELREAMERSWVMTIDAFCARLLRENAIEAGLAPDFAVLDEASANRARREAAEAALDKLFQERPAEMRRLMEALALSTSDDDRQIDLAESLLDVHESMRLAGIQELPSPQALHDVLPEARRLAAEIGCEPAWGHLHDWVREFLELPPGPLTQRHFEITGKFTASLRPKRKGSEAVRELRDVALKRLESQWVIEWYSGMPELLRVAVARLDQEYRRSKRQQAAVDFADLGESTIELLERDAALRQRIVNQFDHILMDELQDTNRLQWKLVQLLRRRNAFFAVGDINQSIYGFRHADRTVFEEFRAELLAKEQRVDELRENYRSRGEILQTVEQVLSDCPGVEKRDLVAMRTVEGRDPVIQRLAGIGDHAIEQEAELVAACIAEWQETEHLEWGDFAILVRALNSAEPFERALEKRGIPFVVSGGRTFMETREARDFLCLLAALVNPLDEIATAGVLRGPLVGWTDQQLFSAGPEGRLEEFEKQFGATRRLAGFIPPDRLLAKILDERGYAGLLTDRGRANVDKLLGWIRREHSKHPRPLAELLEDLEALRDAKAEAEAPPQQASDAVSIMTIHAAKGLEYKVVFVSALHKFPNRRSPVLLFSGDIGLGAKWRHPATGEPLKDAAHEELSADLKKRESEEEERLLYVAMTRAEDRLVFSHANQKSSPPLLKKVVAAVPEADGSFAVDTAGERHIRLIRPLTIPNDLILDPPVLTGQYDSSVSPTDVALFSACPRKYFLERYLGFKPEATVPGTGAIELGLAAHAALAGEISGSEEIRELVRRFESSEFGRRIARASRVEREFDFALALEDVIVRGQIDVWFEENGELVLLDYKTDREQFRAAEYSLQLRLYALALEKYAGRVPDGAALCFLRSGDVAQVSLDRGDLDEAREMVRALARAQDSLQFPLKVGGQCRRCQFFGGECPAKMEEASV